MMKLSRPASHIIEHEDKLDPYSARALSTRIAVLQMELNHCNKLIERRNDLIANLFVALLFACLWGGFSFVYILISWMI